MIRLFGFIIFVFVLGHVFNISIEGRAFASSVLASDVTAVATSIPVADVSVFHPGGDLIYFESGEIAVYTGVNVGAGTLTGVSRAQAKTSASAHPAGSVLRGSEAGAVERLTQFRVSTSDSIAGRLTMPFQLSFAFISAIPKFLTWDYPALNSGAGLYIKYIVFYPISGMLVVGVVSMLVGALSGVFTR